MEGKAEGEGLGEGDGNAKASLADSRLFYNYRNLGTKILDSWNILDFNVLYWKTCISIQKIKR